jgi:hypothetical protein
MDTHIWQAGRSCEGKCREGFVVGLQDLVCSSSRHAQRLAMHCGDASRMQEQEGLAAVAVTHGYCSSSLTAGRLSRY